MAQKSQIRLLAELIMESVDSLETALQQHNIESPSLDRTADIQSELIFTMTNPEALKNIPIILAAAQQLVCTIDNPAKRMVDYSMTVRV